MGREQSAADDDEPARHDVLALRIVVVATGTDVGKTHVTCALLAHLRASKIPALGWKPIASGGTEDAKQHADAAGTDYVHPSYAFAKPISPHLAAREEGVTIDFEKLRVRADELERRGGVLVVETAGGMFSPLVPELSKALAPASFVLVAPDRLGVLHDVTAVARAADIPLAGVVLSTPESSDASTGTNAAEIERLRILPLLAVFPRAAWDFPESHAAAERVWSAVLARP